MNNFIDLLTNEEFYIHNYSSSNGKYFYPKTKRELINPNNGNLLSPITPKWEGDMPNINKFASLSLQDKQKSLRQRSQEHSKTLIPNKHDI